MTKHKNVINMLEAIDNKWEHTIRRRKQESPSYNTDNEEKIRSEIQDAIKTLRGDI